MASTVQRSMLTLPVALQLSNQNRRARARRRAARPVKKISPTGSTRMRSNQRQRRLPGSRRPWALRLAHDAFSSLILLCRTHRPRSIRCRCSRFSCGTVRSHVKISLRRKFDCGTTSAGKVHLPTQRDFMRHLYRTHRGDEDAVISAYAEAEQRGAVKRASNEYDISAEEYASRLLEDARKKGWINGI